MAAFAPRAQSVHPFKLTYNKLISTTHDFDSVMSQNPAVALSFESQFIPEMTYTYTYDRFFERERINGINFTATVTEVSNIFNGIRTACGVKGKKKLFGTPFSQFVKGQAQLVYSRRLVRGSDQWLVSRVLIGAAACLRQLSGGAVFRTVLYRRSKFDTRLHDPLHRPGSYRAPEEIRNGYFDRMRYV